MSEASTSRLQSTSSLTDTDKRHVLSLLPSDSRVLSVASARVYYAPFKARGDDWAYTGLQGLLVFGATVNRDTKSNTSLGTTFVRNYWFRLADLVHGKGVIWSHQIPLGFDYRLDKPFFHFFSGMERMYGFRFEDDGEANRFYRKITSRIRTTLPPSRRKPLPPTPQTPAPPAKEHVSPKAISSPSPGTFVHVAHVGFSDDGRMEASKNVPSAWKAMLRELQSAIAKKVVDDDVDFIDGFWVGLKAVRTAPPKAQPPRAPAVRRGPRPVHRKPVQAI